MRIEEYERGFRDGMDAAVTRLLAEARMMNDPHARKVLNSAADTLAQDEARRRREAGR